MSFLRFQAVNPPAEYRRTTVVIDVLSARHGDRLGSIYYYPPWRQYVLESSEAVVWSDGCLSEVRCKVAALNAEQRRAAQARRKGAA